MILSRSLYSKIMNLRYSNNKQAGFTLVELAIVMIIIGLLIGGILKGQELVENARVTNTVRIIKEIKAVAVTFEDRYRVLPGDARANRIPGCNGANNCVGGNENGTVTFAPQASAVAWSTFLNPASNWREAYEFWKQLALLDMFSGVDESANPLDANERAWGSTNPRAPVGGGFEFFYDHATTIGIDGHILRISERGMTGGLGNNGGSVAPAQAAKIDRKLDNGRAFSGEVYADYGAVNTPCKNRDVYNESNTDARCVLFIRLFQ